MGTVHILVPAIVLVAWTVFVFSLGYHLGKQVGNEKPEQASKLLIPIGQPRDKKVE